MQDEHRCEEAGDEQCGQDHQRCEYKYRQDANEQPCVQEPVATPIPTGTARKVRLATTLVTAVIAEQIRK